MRHTINLWLRNILIIWTIILASLMSCGVMSKAHIGSITWGPTTDIWAMSIAISKIKYGLDGGIGYRAVALELAKHLTSTGDDLNVNDAATAALDDQPSLVTRAIAAATLLTKNIMPPLSTRLNNNFITTMGEDIGYADFYNISFRLFGFNAYSTHYMYFMLLFFSLAIYFFAFYRSSSAVILSALLMSSLFLVSTSTGIFTPTLPNFAANRFLSTLALFPLLHCIAYLFLSNEQKRTNQVCLILQAILLAFTLKLRSSSSWMLIGYAIILLSMVFVHYYRYVRIQKGWKISLKVLSSGVGLHRVKIAFVILAIVLTTYDVTRYLALNKVYFSDDVMPHHMVWHSAYIGLALNPHWPEKLPYPELAGLRDDGLVWKLDDIYIKRDPKHYYLSSITNGYRIRVHEKIVRNEFLSFAIHNPGYMLQLYFYYKPYLTFNAMRDIFTGLTVSGILVVMIGFLAAAVLAINTLRRSQALKIIGISGIIWCASYLPIIWTYPSSHVMSDQFLTTLLFIAVLFVMIFPIICNTKVNSNSD